MAQALLINGDLYRSLQNNQLAACFLKRVQLWQVNAPSRLLQVLFLQWLGDSHGTWMCFFPFGSTRLRAVVWARCEALWEPRLHFTDTQACAFMPRPIKMALPGCYLLGLAAAVQEDLSFLWSIFTARGARNSSLWAIFSSTRVDLTSLDT